MRIYLSGNEDTCKWHLPVVQSMLNNWVLLCQKSGIKQNTFQHVFEDTGTTVQAQYIFGDVSVQLHAPSQQTKSAAQEESKVDLSCPRVFYIETSGGYFWVIVQRDADGVPLVRLEQFTPTDAEGFVFQIMEHQTPGMLASSINKKRYVVTQGAGVFTGECNEKGLVLLPPSCDGIGRITPDFAIHKYVVVAGDYESKSIRMVDLSFLGGKIVADLKYTEASSLLAVDAGQLVPTTLHPNPCWIHRKCFGSYFSPNKTIGYHVDIGIDDEFLGNLSIVRGGDLLDNDGGFPEAMFNHTKDLARFIGLLNFPVAVSGSTVTIILESPTMEYTSETGEKCWGGYTLTQSEYGCADYQMDFSSWLLSPRPVLATYDLITGRVEFADIATPSNEDDNATSKYDVISWDGRYKSTLTLVADHRCGTKSYEEFFPDETLVGNCDWIEECTGSCWYNDPTSYSGDCAKIWDVLKHKSAFFREDLSVSRHMYLVFGGRDVSPFRPQDMTAFFFMFDGFWHLDVGLHWAHQRIVGDYCQLCSVPSAGQEPGELIWFYVGGSSSNEQIEATGHEFVENLEVVTPLGHIPGPYGLEIFGFVARVPERFAAPHEPVVLTGGIEYVSGMDSDAVVKCEKSLMSEPCECATNVLSWDEGASALQLSGGALTITDGCGPFNWVVTGADLVDLVTSENYGNQLQKTTITSLSIVGNEPLCGISITVWDACNRKVTKESELTVGNITGVDIMAPDSTAVFTLDTNTSIVIYTGDLEFVSQSGASVTLRMPSNACGGEYAVTLSACGVSATKYVRPTNGRWVEIGMAQWYSQHSQGIGHAVWGIFPTVPGYIWEDYYTLNGEAFFGKYKCNDSILVYRTATPEGCANQPRQAPFCCTCVPGAYTYGTTTDCEYFHEYYFNGESRGHCANGEQTRRVWEWKC